MGVDEAEEEDVDDEEEDKADAEEGKEEVGRTGELVAEWEASIAGGVVGTGVCVVEGGVEETRCSPFAVCVFVDAVLGAVADGGASARAGCVRCAAADPRVARVPPTPPPLFRGAVLEGSLGSRFGSLLHTDRQSDEHVSIHDESPTQGKCKRHYPGVCPGYDHKQTRAHDIYACSPPPLPPAPGSHKHKCMLTHPSPEDFKNMHTRSCAIKLTHTHSIKRTCIVL